MFLTKLLLTSFLFSAQGLTFGDAITPSIEFYDGVTLGIGFELPVYSLGSGATNNIRLEVLPLLHSASVGISMTADQNYKVYTKRENKTIATDVTKADTAIAEQTSNTTSPREPSLPSQVFLPTTQFTWDTFNVVIPQVHSYYSSYYRTHAQVPAKYNGALAYLNKMLTDDNDAISWKITSNYDMQVMVYPDMDAFRQGYLELLNLNPDVNDTIAELKSEYGWGVLVRGLYTSSEGYRAGLRPGDVIRSCGGDKCNDYVVGSLHKASTTAYYTYGEGWHIPDSVSLDILRDGVPLTVWIKPVFSEWDGITGPSTDNRYLVQLSQYKPKIYPALKEALDLYTGMNIDDLNDFYDPATSQNMVISLGLGDGAKLPPHSKITEYFQTFSLVVLTSSGTENQIISVLKYDLQSPTLNKNGRWW
ncbi:MAG: PDZ domain-containing protein [candidate division WOR-3 bacterium]|nr:PDZ domain-containing protein [candidate division WOR-3 bacterium]